MGRSVEEVKRLTVEGAVRGSGMEGSLGGRRSREEEAGPRVWGAPRRLPRGRRWGEMLGTPGPDGRAWRASAALRRTGAAPGAELR